MLKARRGHSEDGVRERQAKARWPAGRPAFVTQDSPIRTASPVTDGGVTLVSSLAHILACWVLTRPLNVVGKGGIKQTCRNVVLGTIEKVG